LSTGTREETFFDDIQLRVNRSIESRIERRALEQQLSIAKENRAELQATMRMGATAKRGMQDMLAGHNDLDSPGVRSYFAVVWTLFTFAR
jgi:hypothetical protein